MTLLAEVTAWVKSVMARCTAGWAAVTLRSCVWLASADASACTGSCVEEGLPIP